MGSITIIYWNNSRRERKGVEEESEKEIGKSPTMGGTSERTYTPFARHAVEVHTQSISVMHTRSERIIKIRCENVVFHFVLQSPKVFPHELINYISDLWPRCVRVYLCVCIRASTVSKGFDFSLSPFLSLKSSEILFTSFLSLSVVFHLIKNVICLWNTLIRTGYAWFSHPCGKNHGRFSRSDIEFKQRKLCRRTRANLD